MMKTTIERCILLFLLVVEGMKCHESLLNLCNTTASFDTIVPADETFLCSIPNDTTLTLEVEISYNTSAVMIQFHTLEYLVEVNSTSAGSEETVTGYHAGLLQYTNLDEESVSWSVQTFTNCTVNATFRVTLFEKDDPIPGACCQVFILENEPNLHFNETPSSDLANIKFAAANVGVSKGEFPRPCDHFSKSPAMQLVYDMYIYYMPAKDYRLLTMRESVDKMTTVEAVKKHGQKVHSLTELMPKEVYTALFKNRGIVYNVLVHDPQTNTTSAYIPYVNYSCDSRTNGNICTYTDMGPTLVFTFCGLTGAILCFLGHWTFLYEIYMFGFLPTVVGFYMIFTAHTDLLPYGIMTAAITLGLFGGAVHTVLWWRFGRVIPTVLWISLVLGFHLASILYFTPFGYLSVWVNNMAYGLAFACAILIVPIFGLLFPKWISLISCAVIGSYMMISTLSFFLGGILQYITENIVHRASIENFDKAVFVLPGNPVDYVLGVLWFALFIAGLVTQWRLTRNEKDFPSCPYQSFKERRRLLRFRSQEGTQSVLISGTVNNSEVNEHTPLVGDL